MIGQRRILNRSNSLNIETRDAKRCATARDELLAGGRQLKVPCLRIEDAQGQVEWLYESSDIVSYPEARFVTNSVVAAA